MFSGSLLEHPIAHLEKPSPLSANDVSLILGIHHGDKWWYSWLDSWTSLGNPSKYALIYYHFRNMKEHQKKNPTSQKTPKNPSSQPPTSTNRSFSTSFSTAQVSKVLSRPPFRSRSAEIILWYSSSSSSTSELPLPAKIGPCSPQKIGRRYGNIWEYLMGGISDGNNYMGIWASTDRGFFFLGISDGTEFVVQPKDMIWMQIFPPHGGPEARKLNPQSTSCHRSMLIKKNISDIYVFENRGNISISIIYSVLCIYMRIHIYTHIYIHIIMWGWVKTLYPFCSHQNSWDLWMFIPL